MSVQRLMWIVVVLSIVAVAQAGGIGFLAWRQVSLEEDVSQANQRLAQVEGTFSQELQEASQRLADELDASRAALRQEVEVQRQQLSAEVQGLSQRLDQTKSELAAADAALSQQGAQLRADLDATRAQTQDRDTQLQSSLDQARADLDTLRTQVDEKDALLAQRVDSQVADLTNRVNTVAAEVDTLENQTSTLAQAVATSVIDAEGLYQRLRPSVVKVKVTTPTGDGLGSGFVVGSRSDFVVTAYHVIENANTIIVVTSDGVEHTATVVTSSLPKDVALLKLPQPLAVPSLVLADSDQVAVGSPVLVIGNPFDMEWTATTGIISGLDREETVEGRTFTGLIQYDAASNPGNSGGPVFNAKGEVIGMSNLAIKPGVGWGISMAVTSNDIKAVIGGSVL